MVIFAMCLTLGFLPEAKTKVRTQKTVQTERRAATQKIEQAKGKLTANEEQTRRELLNLQAIEGEIRIREDEASRLSAMAASLRRDSKALADSIAANEVRLKELRESYARAMRAARRQRQSAGDASFIFSSKSFSQARSRLRYLKELSSWQSGKTEEIGVATVQLTERRERLDSIHKQLSMSLDSLSRVRRVLGEQKHQADAVVGSLKRQSRNLKKVISEQQRLVKQLDDELNRIIEAEATRRCRSTPQSRGGSQEETAADRIGSKNSGYSAEKHSGTAKPSQPQSRRPSNRTLCAMQGTPAVAYRQPRHNNIDLWTTHP